MSNKACIYRGTIEGDGILLLSDDDGQEIIQDWPSKVFRPSDIVDRINGLIREGQLQWFVEKYSDGCCVEVRGTEWWFDGGTLRRA